MGIQTTKTISREAAIERIQRMWVLMRDREYRQVEAASHETEESLVDAVHQVSDGSTCNGLDKWTNGMLAELLDKPFWRESMFDNYCVVDSVESCV